MGNKVGDIFEINSPEGKDYVHYIFRHEELGDIVRILPGMHTKRPTNLDPLVTSSEPMIAYPHPSLESLEKVGHYAIENFKKARFRKNRPKVCLGDFSKKGRLTEIHEIDLGKFIERLKKNQTKKPSIYKIIVKCISFLLFLFLGIKYH